jgi:hypothetical protein
MRLMHWRTALLFGLVLSLPATAFAEESCNDAYGRAQVLRKAGKLRATKQALVACSQETCSSAVRTDCLKWTDEVERALSTVVFDVRLADGSEVTDVRVYAGGELVASTLDGRQIALDPGEAVLRFVRGSEALEKRVVIREGEKFRTIRIDFPRAPAPGAAAVAPAPAPVAAPPVQPLPEPAPESPRSIPTLSWVLGGVAVAGFATFGVLASTGYAKESSLRDDCLGTRSCASSDVQSVRTQYLIGDIALGIGVASLAGGIAYWLLNRPARASTAGYQIVPVVDSRAVAVGVRLPIP